MLNTEDDTTALLRTLKDTYRQLTGRALLDDDALRVLHRAHARGWIGGAGWRRVQPAHRALLLRAAVLLEIDAGALPGPLAEFLPYRYRNP